MKRDDHYKRYIMGQYDNRNEAIDIIKSDQCILNNHNRWDEFKYVIVDLNYVVPWFKKLGTLSNKLDIDGLYIFYSASRDDLIDFDE